MLRNMMTMVMTRTLVAVSACAALPTLAQTMHTYDFAWYAGAPETWVYEAGPKLLVDVYEDTSTPENDVLFRVRNAIDTELGYLSSISDLQFDTGSLMPGVFASVAISPEDSSGYFSYRMYPPGNPQTLIDSSGAVSRIAWSGDYAAGRTSDGPKEYGINPGEHLVFRALLNGGYSFADVIQALNVGVSSAYANGHYGLWTTAQKQSYRAEATKGLRVALLVHSIVPNSWDPDGHGLFMTHKLVDVTDENAPRVTALSATPAELLDTQTSQLIVQANDPDAGPQPLSYQWSVVNGGGVIDDPSSVSPIYMPDDVTGSRLVTVQVAVSDGEHTVTRSLTLQVNDAHATPPNVAPQINELNASPSTLPDDGSSQLSVVATDPDAGPQALSYQWTIVNGGGVLDNPGSATPVYTPADVVGTQSVTLKVVVSDGDASISGNLTLTVEDANPPPPGAELLVEDFSAGSLSGWSVRDEGTLSAPSKWRIVSGELMQQTNIRDGGTASALAHLGTYLSYDAGLAWTDYRAKFKLRTTDDDTLGLMFRFQDNDNYYRFSWDKQLNQRRLVKKAGGVFSLLAADNVPYVMGQNYQVEIVAQGTGLEVWIDGVRIFQVSDASLNRGSVAFYTWQNNAAYFDDIQVNAAE